MDKMDKRLAIIVLILLSCWGYCHTAGTGAVTVQASEVLESAAVKSESELFKVKRGTITEEQRLSGYLYYFNPDGEFCQVDTNSQTPEEGILRSGLGKKIFNTSIFPDENGTGNRFLVFYDGNVKKTASFIVFDKLTQGFDETTFADLDESYSQISMVYPSDYGLGGDDLHPVFIVVFSYLDVNEIRNYALVRFEKTITGEMLKTVLERKAAAFFFNANEKKMAWLKQPNPAKVDIWYHEIVYRKTGKGFSLNCRASDIPGVDFLAFDHVVISFNDPTNHEWTRRVYQMPQDTPLYEFADCSLFSYSLRHKQGEFHLLFKGKDKKSNSLLLHHLDFDQEAEEQKLSQGSVPSKTANQILNDPDVKEVLFLVKGNTYYLASIIRLDKGYQLVLDKLNDNFKGIISRLVLSVVPGWLSISDGECDFKAEGNVLIITSLAKGQIRGMGYINKQGVFKFIPGS